MNAGGEPTSLAAAGRAILCVPDPCEKIELTRKAYEAWRCGAIAKVGNAAVPDHPARPDRPRLLAPGKMPRRRKGIGPENRIALLLPSPISSSMLSISPGI